MSLLRREVEPRPCKLTVVRLCLAPKQDVYLFNDRAIATYEKIGFKREGIKRDGGYFHHQYYDLICMGVLEDEFRAKYLSELLGDSKNILTQL